MPSLRAFSLVELLVVVAIIAILSSLAIPAYSNYIIKARVTELLSIADAYKLKAVDNWFNADADNQSVYNLNTNLIDYVSVNSIDGHPSKHVIQVVAKMKGVEVGEIIAWSCHVAPEYNKYVPKSCQNNDLAAVSLG